MAKHNVEVRQLKLEYDDAFLNVDVRGGHIAVNSTSYSFPVYLLLKGHSFELVVFANEEWALESKYDFFKHYDFGWRIVDGNLEPISVASRDGTE